MSESLKSLIRKWSRHGMHWPFVHDPTIKKPSVTLMFFYIGFMMAATVIAASSVMQLIKGDLLQATFMPSMLAFISFVFYRLRKLDNVKIDLNDQEIELSSNDDEEKDEDA